MIFLMLDRFLGQLFCSPLWILLSSGVFDYALQWSYGPSWCHCPLPSPWKPIVATSCSHSYPWQWYVFILSPFNGMPVLPASCAAVFLSCCLSSASLHLEHLACCDCLLRLCSQAASWKPATLHLLLHGWCGLCGLQAGVVTRSFTKLAEHVTGTDAARLKV